LEYLCIIFLVGESCLIRGRSNSDGFAAVKPHFLKRLCVTHGLFEHLREMFIVSENTKLRLYTVDMKYIRNLHNADDRVPSVSPQIGKEDRPFIGIVAMVNGRKYCIPLTKPKPKHNTMRGSIDFTKIIHNGEMLGALNFNQMIPVEDSQLRRIDIVIHKHDNADTKRKKVRLIKEAEWLDVHETEVNNKARVLYEKYYSGEEFSAKKNCLNFKRLEEVCDKFNSNKGQ